MVDPIKIVPRAALIDARGCVMRTRSEAPETLVCDQLEPRGGDTLGCRWYGYELRRSRRCHKHPLRCQECRMSPPSDAPDGET